MKFQTKREYLDAMQVSELLKHFIANTDALPAPILDAWQNGRLFIGSSSVCFGHGCVLGLKEWISHSDFGLSPMNEQCLNANYEPVEEEAT